MDEKLAEVRELYRSNYRDAPATLRNIADGIERGDYGSVQCVAVAMLGSDLEVFACGEDSEADRAGMVLYAGFQKLMQRITSGPD